MKKFLIICLTIATICPNIHGQSFVQEIAKFQEELNLEFSDRKESPLTKKDRRKFKVHDFFQVDEKYRVEATFVRADDTVPFQMKTTTDRLPTYEKYGEATFEIDSKLIKLNIYQSHRMREMDKYKDHLFLPFTDLTNGEESYGGGRYIDLIIPIGDTIVIDFNKRIIHTVHIIINIPAPFRQRKMI